MVSLKWGDVLSHLLPGAVALYAAAPFFPSLARLLDQPNTIGPATGLALLMAAALAGGILEAFTRITWERYFLVKRCRVQVEVLGQLTKDNLPLYERGVQSSYKYVTFYANFAWAILCLVVSRAVFATKPSIGSSLCLAAPAVVLLLASYVQWTYFVNYQNKVFGPRNSDAEERPAAGHQDSVSAGDTQGQSLLGRNPRRSPPKVPGRKKR